MRQVPAALVAALLAPLTVGAQRRSLEPIEPGSYLSPLVRLQRLQGVSDHLHVDEIRLHAGLLLQCSYTFAVVDARAASDMEYLSQGLRHAIPGETREPGCIHLAPDETRVFTTHRGNIRNPAFLSGWDITDPRSPRQLPVLREPGTSYEGIDVAKGHVFVALHDKGLGVYRFDPENGFLRVGSAVGFENAWGVAASGDTVFVADGMGGLVTVDVAEPARPRVLGRAETGGQATGVVVDPDARIAYVAAGSAGLVVVDVAEPERPMVVARTPMPGSAVRVDYSDGHVFVAAWNDARVYDVSSPRSPRFKAAVRLTKDLAFDDADRPAPTSRVLGIAARGNDVFVGNWHVLYSYRLFPERVAPRIRLPETASLVDFGPVRVGESRTLPLEILNEGTAPLTVLNNWVVGDAFTVSPSRVRIPPGESTRLAIGYRPVAGGSETGYLEILSDDPQAPRRTAYLVGNRTGLGVGMPLPETKGVLLDGTSWSSRSWSSTSTSGATSTETRGTVTLLAYFATF